MTDTFITVGLWAGSGEVKIEKSRGLAFEPMKSDCFGTLAAAPFPVRLGQTYELTVVADHATIYCYLDGQFVVLAQEPDFSAWPVGRVGFFTNAATGAFRDVSVSGLRGVTSSPVTPYAGNPLNVGTYSPAVVRDDRYRMWDGLGRYAESEDGVAWTRPAGAQPVVTQGNTGDWPSGNACGDPDVLKVGGQYWITFWSVCNRRNGAFDGMGIKRSSDGIHWTPEPANPIFYMGPYADWDELVVGDHALIRDGDRFKLWHVGITRGQRGYRNEFGYAESEDGIHWRKCRLNPVLTQGRPGTWDGGWIYAAGVVKIDDEESDSHVYAGKPGASYHLFYTGQPSNNELSCGVKRIGHAFSLDGIHWVKWDDAGAFAPLKNVADQLAAGRSVTESVLWSLPPERLGNTAPQIELAGLNVAAANHPVMIEVEAKCNRFDVARVAWSTGAGFKAGQEMEFLAGYPGVEFPIHRVTIATDGQPISALRLQFPAGATVELRQVRIRQLRIAPAEGHD